MPRFFGDTVEQGDSLYDLIDGPVRVISVSESGIRCVKGGNPNSVRSYSFDGILSGRRQVRTLYWHNPVLIEPRKGGSTFDAQAKAIGLLAALIGDIAEANQPLDQAQQDVLDTQALLKDASPS